MDAMCAKQLVIDTAIAENIVCYNAVGSTYGARCISNLGKLMTCQFSDINTPSFNCRTVADEIWPIVPSPENPVPGTIVRIPTPAVPTAHCVCNVKCSWYSLSEQSVVVYGIDENSCNHGSDGMTSAEFQACDNGKPHSLRDCTWKP